MGLRVVHAAESLEPQAGSAAVCLTGLVRALRAGGIESDSVGFNDREPTSPGSGEITTLVGRADLVHLHGWRHPKARLIARTAKRASKPYIISPHGTLGHGKYNKKNWRMRLGSLLSERRLVRGAALVTALNDVEDRELRSRRVHARVVQLRYGLDVDRYAVGASPDDSLASGATASSEVDWPTVVDGLVPKASRILLMLGPIHPIEGFVPLLKAFAEVGHDADGWGVVLAGRETGDWRKILEAAVRRKGEEDRVVITAAPNVAAQRTWLARATVLAAPSLQVRCPVSVLQAVAAGVPVLASRCIAPGGLENVIRICGTSRQELKAALQWLFSLSDSDRIDFGQRAGEVGRAAFDWSVLVDEYIRLYRSLV